MTSRNPPISTLKKPDMHRLTGAETGILIAELMCGISLVLPQSEVNGSEDHPLVGPHVLVGQRSGEPAASAGPLTG